MRAYAPRWPFVNAPCPIKEGPWEPFVRRHMARVVRGAMTFIGLLAGMMAITGCQTPYAEPGTVRAPSTQAVEIKTYEYKSGQTKLQEAYEQGELVRSTWYFPNGEIFRVTRWENGTGTGYYLDEQGRVTAEIPYVNGVAEGVGFRFDRDGDGFRVTEVRYRDGVRQ